MNTRPTDPQEQLVELQKQVHAYVLFIRSVYQGESVVPGVQLGRFVKPNEYREMMDRTRQLHDAVCNEESREASMSDNPVVQAFAAMLGLSVAQLIAAEQAPLASSHTGDEQVDAAVEKMLKSLFDEDDHEAE